jgi:hypothetical protein
LIRYKFIDYLRNVQMKRWLDWTMERDQEPYIDQVQVYRLPAPCTNGALAGLDYGEGSGALH